MDDTANSHMFQVKIAKKQNNFFKIQFSLHVVENNQHEDKKRCQHKSLRTCAGLKLRVMNLSFVIFFYQNFVVTVFIFRFSGFLGS